MEEVIAIKIDEKTDQEVEDRGITPQMIPEKTLQREDTHHRDRVIYEEGEDAQLIDDILNDIGNIKCNAEVFKINLKRIKLLTKKCRCDRVLLQKATDSLIDSVVRITNRMHRRGNLDMVCLALLTLMVSTTTGLRYFDDKGQVINHWWGVAQWQPGWAKAFNRFHVVYVAQENSYIHSMYVEQAKRSSENSFPTSIINVDLVATLLREAGVNFSCSLVLGDDFLIRSIDHNTLRKRVLALPRLYEKLPREKFCGLFTRSCPGCIGLNIICAAEVLNDSRLLCNVVKEMLNDPPGEIFTKKEMDMFRELSREYYFDNSRVGIPYPAGGNCIEFTPQRKGNPLINAMLKFGELIKSPLFSSKMLQNRPECIEFVKEYFTNKTNLSVDQFCEL